MNALSIELPATPFRLAEKHFDRARMALLANSGDEQARAALAVAADQLIDVRARGYSQMNKKISAAMDVDRMDIKLLRSLFWDTYESPQEEVLYEQLELARDTLAEDLQTMYESFCEFVDGERRPAPCPEEAELIDARERQLAEIEQVLMRPW